MEKIHGVEEGRQFELERSSIKEAYHLLGAKSPLELNRLYVEEDQKLMRDREWDYANPALVTNKIKEILENCDTTTLTEDEREWRNEILYFWYHHAISSAIWRHKDQRAAQEYSARALELQSKGHPNQITQLFYFLTRDQLDEAEKWVSGIEEDKDTAEFLIDNYKNGKFYTDKP